MRMPASWESSPSNSASCFAMMRSTVDLPEPFRPSSPILAPGKKEREMSLMICRLGGTTLLTRNIDITYWAMEGRELSTKAGRSQGTGAGGSPRVPGRLPIPGRIR